MHGLAHEHIAPSDANADEALVTRGDFQVRLADDDGRRSKSNMLVNTMYSWRGYKVETEPLRLDQMTLQSCRAGYTFGTITLVLDSVAGLAADALYKDQIDSYRGPNHTVCEFTRLAVDSEHGSKEVLGALFHLAYIFAAVMRGVTDFFIEVNPRHVAFYKRMLEFRPIGETKLCPRVNAPAVLLHLETSYVAEQVERYGGHRGKGRRSLYPYFFSKKEQDGLANRLMGIAAPPSASGAGT